MTSRPIITAYDLTKISTKKWNVFIDNFIQCSKNVRCNIINKHAIDTTNQQSQKEDDINYSTCMYDILRDTYMWNMVSSYVNMMNLLEPMSIWGAINEKLDIVTNEFYSDMQFKHAIQLLHNTTTNSQSKQFLHKIITNYNVHMYPTANNIFGLIAKNVNKQFTYNHNQGFVIKNIGDFEGNSKLYLLFMQMVDDELIDELIDLIMRRNVFAKPTTYFKLKCATYDVSETNISTITDLINTIDYNVSNKCKIELNNIKKIHGATSSIYDILSHTNAKMMPKIKFCEILDEIFRIFKLHFGLICKFDTMIVVYEQNTLMGKIYIYNSPTISSPMAIKLSDKIIIGHVSMYTEMGLLINDDAFHLLDTVNIFMEFGHILRNISYKASKYCAGLINNRDDFYELIPNMMAYFAYDFISSIYPDFPQTISAHKCATLKINILHSKFDHIIHNSPKFLNAMECANKIVRREILTKLYSHLYKRSFCNLKQSSQQNHCDFSRIDVNFIAKETKKCNGILYSNVINDIYGYILYWLIKHKNISNFREQVLTNGFSDFRDEIRKFIQNNSDVDYFKLFMNNVLHVETKEKSHIETETINYFDDGTLSKKNTSMILS